MTLAGDGSGSVSSSPAGIDCGTDCSEAYDDGTLVTLTAVADTGSDFSGWSGEGCSGTGTCQVTMDAARSVTATFDLEPTPTFLLSVTLAGDGSGSVSSSPTGIDCGTDCSESLRRRHAGDPDRGGRHRLRLQRLERRAAPAPAPARSPWTRRAA